MKIRKSKRTVLRKQGRLRKPARSSVTAIAKSARIKKTLHESEIRYRRLFEAAQDGILILNESTGRITDVNPFLMTLLGLPREKFIGKMIWEIGLFQDVEKSRSAFRELKRKGYIRYEDLPLETKDGRYIDVEFVSNVYRADGVKVIQCNIRDITQRKHAEVEKAILVTVEEEQRRIGQDLHDGLCQQLTGIALLAKALAQKILPLAPNESANASEIADMINQSIDQTRDLARGLSPIEIEVSGLVPALQKLADSIVRLYKISCIFNHSKSTDVECLSETSLANHLYRIVQEAVTNAIKHGKAKHVVIKLDVVKESGLLTIEDDGIGFNIDGEEMMGLGLRSMRYRGRLIGARITISASKSGGTLVTCTFTPVQKRRTKNGKK